MDASRKILEEKKKRRAAREAIFQNGEKAYKAMMDELKKHAPTSSVPQPAGSIEKKSLAQQASAFASRGASKLSQAASRLKEPSSGSTQINQLLSILKNIQLQIEVCEKEQWVFQHAKELSRISDEVKSQVAIVTGSNTVAEENLLKKKISTLKGLVAQIEAFKGAYELYLKDSAEQKVFWSIASKNMGLFIASLNKRVMPVEKLQNNGDILSSLKRNFQAQYPDESQQAERKEKLSALQSQQDAKTKELRALQDNVRKESETLEREKKSYLTTHQAPMIASHATHTKSLQEVQEKFRKLEVSFGKYREKCVEVLAAESKLPVLQESYPNDTELMALCQKQAKAKEEYEASKQSLENKKTAQEIQTIGPRLKKAEEKLGLSLARIERLKSDISSQAEVSPVPVQESISERLKSGASEARGIITDVAKVFVGLPLTEANPKEKAEKELLVALEGQIKKLTEQLQKIEKAKLIPNSKIEEKRSIEKELENIKLEITNISAEIDRIQSSFSLENIAEFSGAREKYDTATQAVREKKAARKKQCKYYENIFEEEYKKINALKGDHLVFIEEIKKIHSQFLHVIKNKEATPEDLEKLNTDLEKIYSQHSGECREKERKRQGDILNKSGNSILDILPKTTYGKEMSDSLTRIFERFKAKIQKDPLSLEQAFTEFSGDLNAAYSKDNQPRQISRVSLEWLKRQGINLLCAVSFGYARSWFKSDFEETGSNDHAFLQNHDRDSVAEIAMTDAVKNFSTKLRVQLKMSEVIQDVPFTTVLMPPSTQKAEAKEGYAPPVEKKIVKVETVEEKHPDPALRDTLFSYYSEDKAPSPAIAVTPPSHPISATSESLQKPGTLSPVPEAAKVHSPKLPDPTATHAESKEPVTPAQQNQSAATSNPGPRKAS